MTVAIPRGPYFHRASQLYEAGDRIRPGNWGKLVRSGGGQHLHFFREYVWERVRQARYSSLPSRMTSAFAFETQTGAEAFPIRSEQFPEYVYTVDIVDTPPRHRADMTWWEIAPSRHSFDAMDELAEHYWRGDVTDPSKVEVIVQGELIVVSRVTPIPDDSPPTIIPSP